MRNGGGTILEASSGRYVGPGGQSVVPVGNAWVLIRHYYDASANGAPKMRIGDLYWDASGWPTLTRPPTADTTPPAAPGAPVASGVTSSSLTLSWPAATDDVGVAGYTVFQRGSAGDVQVATATGTSVAVSGLAGSTPYTFFVRARDAAGNVSAASPTVTVTTAAGTTYALTVAKAGTGSGRVTSSPPGLDCGATCSASFASGTTVTLAAAAAAGSTFVGWEGACTGTGSCVTTMTAARSVTAAFQATPVDPAAPCANPITFAGQSGNFNTTGAVCLRTAATVSGWGCSNFADRTVSVNGGIATSACGAGPFPLPRHSDGYTYFAVTAGTYPWASLYTW
jgi:chitodextrinase